MFLKYIALALVGALLGAPAVRAEETTVEKIENQGNEVKKDTKKSGRKLKKKLRDATGNESVTEDLKDSGRNAADEVEYQGKKLKKKID